jgi:hypothetical protein
MELELSQAADSLDAWSTEKILQDFNCNYIFKWKIPGNLDFFMWKRCPYSDAHRLFIIRGTNHTLFTDSDLDTRSKYTPFLEELIIDFKAYSGK